MTTRWSTDTDTNILPMNMYIPNIGEVQYYSEAAWNPGQLQRASMEEGVWESPLSVWFKMEWIVPEFKTWRHISNLMLHISHLVGQIDVNTVQNTIPSPTFDNIPDYNPRRKAFVLSAKQQERIRQIVWQDLTWAEGEIVYTSLGEEVFLRGTNWEMEPIGLSDNF